MTTLAPSGAFTPASARAFWEVVEPLHAVVYFSPEAETAGRDLGLKGWWMGYFAGRAAPLGAVRPEAVTAMFFGFSPHRVARALPAAWAYADPRDVLAARLLAARATLQRLLGDVPSADLSRVAELFERAVGGAVFGGRPLAAAWAGVAEPGDPLLRLWLATTVLREHRGDGHVLAAVDNGLDGLETGLTHAATGTVSRDYLGLGRGWTERDLADADERLCARGVFDADGRLTQAGIQLRADVEEATDRLALGPVRALGEEGLAEVLALATPLARAVFDGGGVPADNPIGVPRP